MFRFLRNTDPWLAQGPSLTIAPYESTIPEAWRRAPYTRRAQRRRHVPRAPVTSTFSRHLPPIPAHGWPKVHPTPSLPPPTHAQTLRTTIPEACRRAPARTARSAAGTRCRPWWRSCCGPRPPPRTSPAPRPTWPGRAGHGCAPVVRSAGRGCTHHRGRQRKACTGGGKGQWAHGFTQAHTPRHRYRRGKLP
jgi:hypothetical protein